MTDYRTFLEAKIKLAESAGFAIDPAEINPALKPHIQVATQWALAGGRRLLASRFGTQKTTWHLEVGRLTMRETKAPHLTVVPIGARLSFFNDAQYFTGEHAIKLNWIKDDSEIDASAINLTNVERVREGNVDPRRFGSLTFDEGDILRNMSTKTFWTFTERAKQVQYRHVATATPDPREYAELLSFAGYLDIMDIGQARTRFFKRNSEKADALTIHAHKESEFWIWVASWALFINRPSDVLGCTCKGKNCSASASATSFQSSGVPVATDAAADGSADATAAARGSPPQTTFSMARTPHADAPGRCTEEKAPGRMPSGKPCMTDAGARKTKTTPTMAVAASASANDGRNSAPSSPTWESRQSAQLSTGSTTMAATSPGTVDGRPEKSRPTIDGLTALTASLGNGRPLCGDGYCVDDGYDLPPLDVRYHEIATDHRDAGEDPNGQKRLIKDSAAGLKGAAKEKRVSLPARIAKMQELRAELPHAHRLIWHDLEDERRAIEKAAPDVVTVYGSQDVDAREQSLIGFQNGDVAELAGKPVMIGSGPNYQYHCWWAIYLGVGWKFKDFIQSLHRIQRYGQAFEGFPADRAPAVRIDIIHTEAEREIVRKLQDNWKRYEEQSARMSALIREYGLAQLAVATALTRTMDVARVEVKGERFTAVNNDNIDEVPRLPEDSVDLVVSSLPFSTQYEYTPSYRDFGHTDDDEHFFKQMDFLTPALLRALKPGRVAAIHCKDRIVEGSRSGLGFQTVEPFGAKVMLHFRSHGFAYIGTKTIVTDVVRENNQTYRLGWTEQCKDGSRMGFGLPEYLHVFRKPQTDRSRGYADEPVVKRKREFIKQAGPIVGSHVEVDPDTGERDVVEDRQGRWSNEDGYSRGRWQLDAAGFGRSSGDRLLMPSELAAMQRGLFRRYKEYSLATVYDFEHHVACSDALDALGKLPPDYALIPAHSWHPDVLTDIARMRSLNTLQDSSGREKHLCPLPLDIVNRAIAQYSMPGDLVLDPFGGLGTVAYCAVLQKRRGYTIELSPGYHRDAVRHCADAERQASTLTLFDLLDARSAAAQAAE